MDLIPDIQSEVSFSDLTRADSASIIEIEKQSQRFQWNSEQVGSELSGAFFCGIAARTPDGQLVGYILGRLIGDEYEITKVVVVQHVRRRGIATALLKTLFDRLLEKKVDKIFLEVAASNDVARRLYATAGFEVLFVRKKYYNDGDDALVMVKKKKEDTHR
ncbi:MAG: ribosomal protein S18-alanine N-acetyltransferase [Chitinivibrionales bacterium]|nr:ribosomal protein S18-alanine N-acetyltransferase [Chitinivibrionales bacterium]